MGGGSAPEARSNVWSEASLRAFWEPELDFPEHYFSNKYGVRIIAELRHHISAGDKVLDYGCGRGALSQRLCKDIGAEVWATDNLTAAVQATSQLNAINPCFRGAFRIEEIRRSEVVFDTVAAIEVLEHLSDRALRGILHDRVRPAPPVGISDRHDAESRAPGKQGRIVPVLRDDLPSGAARQDRGCRATRGLGRSRRLYVETGARDGFLANQAPSPVAQPTRGGRARAAAPHGCLRAVRSSSPDHAISMSASVATFPM
jgi:hypothetical protein